MAHNAMGTVVHQRLSEAEICMQAPLPLKTRHQREGQGHREAPLKRSAFRVLRSAAHATCQVLPNLTPMDLSGFCTAVQLVEHLGFRSRERNKHGLRGLGKNTVAVLPHSSSQSSKKLYNSH
ncbi:hypothetical protein SKAU_G00336230 [Synaphobranchus kaupii]|uniref:Uncharacterized protein n=1 Tax=Synaphobranchus kaupii TaxID=118154 RepID=A0A9Q1EM98_SYNKA|nr:hypothetical protein SKAU_G00336230 [Synaphobranchus kaupii]